MTDLHESRGNREIIRNAFDAWAAGTAGSAPVTDIVADGILGLMVNERPANPRQPGGSWTMMR